MPQTKINTFLTSSPAPKPSTSALSETSAASGNDSDTPVMPRPTLQRLRSGRRLSLPDSEGPFTPAETDSAPPAAAPPAADTTTPSAEPKPSPGPPAVTPSAPPAGTSHRLAGSRSPPQAKPRQPGSPRGLGASAPRKRKSEEGSAENSGDILQEIGTKKMKAEQKKSTKVAEEKEQQSTAEVSFRLKFDLTELKEDFRITAPGDQPILHALQADTRLEKIKKKLSKVFFHPYGENNPIRGVPNMGSPCSVIEGGRFEAKLGKDESRNMTLYCDVELRLSKRSKIYLDLRDRPSNTPWLAKKNTNMFQSPILVDCLPGDTFVTALLRDGRIDKDRVRYTRLICRGSTGEVNIKLTDKSSVNHDKTFTCKVLKTAQVSDEEWEKACTAHDRSCQAMSNSSDVAMSDTTTGNGAPDTQAEVATSGPDTGNKSLQTEWINKLVKMVVERSQTQVAKLLDLDFEQKNSRTAERERKRKLRVLAESCRQDFYNANQETSVLLMEKCCEFGRSVGVLANNAGRLATCFRVGSKYILTNRHVTALMAKRGGASSFFVDFNYKKLSDLDCNDQFVSNDSLIKFRVKRVVCSCQNDDLDYSLLELDVPDDQSDRLPPGLGHLIKETRDMTTVTIVGHPGVRPKKIDPSCPVVGSKHRIAVYLKFHPEGWVDPMINNPSRDNYKSAFGPGASGSPGFDEDGYLVVMHTCGYHLYDGSKTEVQQGVKMVAIREDLKQRDDVKRRDDLPADFLENLFPPPPEPMETD